MVIVLGNINNLIAENIEIFPNPSNGVFHIQNISNVLSIQVNDIFGKSVLKRKNTQNNMTIQLNEKNGVYFIQFAYHNGEKVIRKVVIK